MSAQLQTVQLVNISRSAADMPTVRRAVMLPPGTKQPHQKYFNDYKSEFDEVCCSVSCAFYACVYTKRNTELHSSGLLGLNAFFVFPR